MRTSLAFALAGLSLALAGCLTSHDPAVPGAMGGSVIDFDRGTGGVDLPRTGSPAGAPYTLGVASTNGSDQGEGAPAMTVPPAPPRRPLVAGPLPPTQQGAVASPDTVREVQRALRDLGYYQGPLSGEADPALLGALRRFQADRGLPLTGRLDAGTAQALGVSLPPAAPPPPGAGG